MATKIAILVQARSTSTRFPNKIAEQIANRPMLKMVIDACKASADYLNYASGRYQMQAQVVMVVPENDAIVKRWANCADIYQGSLEDVLGRYVAANKLINADYICRITSDCPMLPPYVISKHVILAVANQYDYVSNVDTRFRTTPDGFDCEVISKRLLQWLHENAQTANEREHVTLKVRENPPEWIRHGCSVGFLDLSDIKISVDTEADLEQVRVQNSLVKTKLDCAVEYFGKENVHRF